MIKKLQKKFIFLTLTSLFVVLSVIIAGINIVYYRNTISDADDILSVLAENDGNFPEFNKEPPELFDDNMPPEPDEPPSKAAEKPQEKLFDNRDDFSTETPYESRYFSVLVNRDTYDILKVAIDRIASVDYDTAVAYANKLMKKKSSQGFIAHFRYLKCDSAAGCRIIFLDCGRSLDSVWNCLIISTGISTLGFLIVAIIIIFFSNRIIGPLSESYEKQKRFITNAGHDIKTPLTIINADADILELELGANEWTEDIHKQTKRLTELTNNLILLTRMEEAENTIQKIDFPISDVITEAACSFQALAQTQQKSLKLSIEPMISIQGDSKGIHQLVTLLLDNALKYSPEHSIIHVKLEQIPKSRQLHLSISNQTIHEISKDQLRSLFDRFYRTDTSRNSETGGYGIGLSIAKAIAEAHNGKIKAINTRDGSLTIQVILPL